MDNAQQVTNNASAQPRPKTKKVVEHVKLDAEKILDIKLSIPKELKEAFVVAVLDSNGVAEQYTVHRPIGITDLSDEAWVMTRTSELRYLLARSIDPAQKELDRALAKARTEFLVAKGLLIQKAEKIFYPPDVFGGKERNLVFDEADRLLKDAKKFHKAEHDYAQQGKPKAAVYHGFPGSRNDFLPEEVKSHEKKIAEAVATDDFKKVAAPIKAKQTFRTRGGPNEDRPQVQSSHIPPGKIEKAIDGISKLLYRVSTQPAVIKQQDSKSATESNAASSTDTASNTQSGKEGSGKNKGKG